MSGSGAQRLAADEALLREAIAFTAAAEGFDQRLIEKDFHATLLLDLLGRRVPGLVFRGGTYLAKAELGFFRLSEDLDFAVSMPVRATRSERRNRVAPVREALRSLEAELPWCRVARPLEGANASRQYAAEVRYRSRLAATEESLLVEIGLREPLVLPPVEAEARTLLLDPVSGGAALPPVAVAGMAPDEAWAEKLRAALSRAEPAIRDFYDVDYGVRHGRLRPDRPEILALLRAKLAVPGNRDPDLSERRRAELRRQVEPRLRPVLRERDFAGFEFGRAFERLVEIYRSL